MRTASSSARSSPALAPTVTAVGGLVASAYLYRTDPHQPGHVLPFCPFRAVTGWQCPACGGTRMAYDLLQSIDQHVLKFVGDTALSDDLTMFVINRS